MQYISYQKDLDLNMVKTITKSLAANGWQGAPIVVWGDTLVTGNHRHAACKALGIEPETITLEEVFEEDGVDFDAVHAEADYPTSDEPLDRLFYALSNEIVEKYGIQW